MHCVSNIIVNTTKVLAKLQNLSMQRYRTHSLFANVVIAFITHRSTATETKNTRSWGLLTTQCVYNQLRLEIICLSRADHSFVDVVEATLFWSESFVDMLSKWLGRFFRYQYIPAAATPPSTSTATTTLVTTTVVSESSDVEISGHACKYKTNYACYFDRNVAY